MSVATLSSSQETFNEPVFTRCSCVVVTEAEAERGSDGGRAEQQSQRQRCRLREIYFLFRV